MRAGGILLPVFSLPSEYGIGTFGRAAYEWVDFLKEAGQSFWQVLPLGPTGYGDSPYQSFSAFAGNPYLIDLELLQEQGLLTAEDCAPCRQPEGRAVDYAALYATRSGVLRKAFQRFQDWTALEEFRRQNRDWLEDYALYMALKEEHGQRPWNEWPRPLRLREGTALTAARTRLAQETAFYAFQQYEFFCQWEDLRAYANRNGVKIIGDVPIYVAMDSADAWAEREIFLLDGEGRPIEVAGCPPDAFSTDGQLWGNPLYRWEVLERDGYAWWLRRLRASFRLFDVVRIDHFRGLESFYAIPFGEATARRGRWCKGPGEDFIRVVRQTFGRGGIIAEDLGFLTPAVHRLLRKSGYPGMKVLQFAFDSREESDYLPHRYGRNCVVYTGTHDNDTTRGWFGQAPRADVRFARQYMGLKSGRDQCAQLVRLALASVADLAVIPLQDYLELGSEARINTPSTLGGNWVWRMEPGAADAALAERILALTKLYGRAPKEKQKHDRTSKRRP